MAELREWSYITTVHARFILTVRVLYCHIFYVSFISFFSVCITVDVDGCLN